MEPSNQICSYTDVGGEDLSSDEEEGPSQWAEDITIDLEQGTSKNPESAKSASSLSTIPQGSPSLRGGHHGRQSSLAGHHRRQSSLAESQSSNKSPAQPTQRPSRHHRRQSSRIDFAEAELQGGYYYYHTNLVMTVMVNLSLVVYAGVAPQTTEFVATGTLACIFVCVLYRWEPFINAWYMVITRTPKSTPAWFRRALARYVISLGGYHTGSGIGTLCWLSLLVSRDIGGVHLGLGIAMLVLLTGAVTFAMVERATYHNLFEQTHRWFGWTALGIAWGFVLYDGNQKGYGEALVITRIVLISLSTLCIFYPWARAKRIPVTSQRLSSHAVMIQFDDAATTMPGRFGRISHSLLGEWHSFAVISDAITVNQHKMVIASAGDWTKDLIASPPEELWVRKTRTCGFMNTVNMFSSTILVATGAGIAPILPFILQKDRFPQVKHIVWATKSPVETFGQDVTNTILGFGDEDMLTVWNATTQGRPNLPLLVTSVADRFKPEAIHVIANKAITVKVVAACRVGGHCCYGAIWDS